LRRSTSSGVFGQRAVSGCEFNIMIGPSPR
jgi:hypothetical protein